MSKKISKYMEWESKLFKNHFVNGKWEDWWDSSNPDLVPTETIQFGYGNPRCIYCGEIAKPIQAGLRNIYYDKHYSVTGYTCYCVGAYKEVIIKNKIKMLETKHSEKIRNLRRLLPEANIKALIELKINQIKLFQD